MDPTDDRLGLLLAGAEDGRPVLDQGVPGEAAQRGPKPKNPPMPRWGRLVVPRAERRDADPNDLALQRWAIVAPEGREGDRQLEAIEAIVRLREHEQGTSARVYRVPPDMSAKDASEWKNDVHESEDVPEEERPRYLLILGDLHQTSAELQHTLANGALVGRVHFADGAGETDLAGYAAYADKVVRHASGEARETAPDLRFFVADDGTAATITGKNKLLGPSLEEATRRQAAGKLPAASVGELRAQTVDELLAEGAGARPGVLLSVSHGLGAPRRGWRREEEQRRRQGAMVLRHDEILDAERLRAQPFLPGGMWFYLACFGAGTPATSAYHSWLTQLAEDSAFGGSVEAVLKSLPDPGRRPFLAALPQAALANPQGPLAVIGHLDLAWTYGFTGGDKLRESRKSRVLNALKTMVRGSRAGVALDELMTFYRETNDQLMMGYQRETDARTQGQPDPTDRVERGHQWMLRNDLRGYVLLGDPAARLPLQQNTIVAPEPTAAVAEVRPSPSSTASTRAEAVLAMLRGDEAPSVIARRANILLETLWDEVEAHRAAARARKGG